ncbi:MAG: glycoside hydrolase TIM-barrel-like domain-containing protein, partial [Pseudomonadota bacterium]
YFPLAGDCQHNIYDAVKQGWQSGEGYNYYYDHLGQKQHLDAPYAWKNISYWHQHEHINPNGNKTLWRPKLKPIWFTECGFPSVDNASAQPNVFYDPESSESAFPVGSNGEVDFYWQQQAIKATIDYFKQNKVVSEIFWWCYDLRPYPTWPDRLDVWRDGGCWLKGHWLNGKITKVHLGLLLHDLLQQHGFTEQQLQITNLDIMLDGVVIDNHSGDNLLQLLQHWQQLFNLQFIDQGNKLVITRAAHDHKQIAISDDNIIDSSLELNNLERNIQTISYLDLARNYNEGAIHVQSNYDLASDLGMVLEPGSLKQLVHNLSNSVDLTEKLRLNYIPTTLDLGHWLKFNYHHSQYQLAQLNFAANGVAHINAHHLSNQVTAQVAVDSK